MADADEISGNPLKAILATSEALVSSVELEEVFAAVAERIGQAMSVWAVSISSYDPERDVCVFEAWWCEGGSTQEDLDYVGTVADMRERPDLRRILDTPGVHVDRIDDPSLPSVDREQMTKWGVKTSVDTTLRVGGQPIGMLGMEERRFVRQFTDIELDLFDKLCELAAIGIHNAMVFRRQRERRRHLASMVSISRALRDDAAGDPLFATIAGSAAQAFAAPRAIIYEYDDQAEALTARGYHQDVPAPGYDTTGVAEPLAQTPANEAILRGGRPVVEQAGDDALHDDTRAEMLAWGERTCLNVPIGFRGTPLGILMLIWTEQERRVTDDELALATGIAAQAAAALHNARQAARAGDRPAPQDAAP